MGTLADQHPELFHYTGVAGVEGILKTQTLWATHARSLNDASELIAFRERLPRIIRPVPVLSMASSIKCPHCPTEMREQMPTDAGTYFANSLAATSF